jgi:hypothetical protein
LVLAFYLYVRSVGEKREREGKERGRGEGAGRTERKERKWSKEALTKVLVLGSVFTRWGGRREQEEWWR